MLTFKDKQKTLYERLATLKSKPTPSELVFKSKLDALGIKHIFQKGFIEGDNYCIVDFYLPKPYKLCIEVDGGYHTTPKQAAKDKWRDKYLTEYRRFKVLRLTNEEAESIKLDDLKRLISL